MIVADSVKAVRIVEGIFYHSSEYDNKTNHVLGYKHNKHKMRFWIGG